MCYAGKEVGTDRWVRPLRSGAEHAIPHFDKVYGPGDPAVIGDIIRSPFLGWSPQDWQQENYIKGTGRWTRQGRADFARVWGLIDEPADLWGVGRSSQNGINDKVRVADAAAFENSLFLIEAEQVVVTAAPEAQRLKHRIRFQYRGIPYRWSMTDPHVNLPAAGSCEIGRALLCCSLPERWVHDDGAVDEHVYKVVAGVITPERFA